MSNINTSLTFLTLLLVLFTYGSADAQRFQGSAVGGLTMSQIDGDDLYGYNKLGITVGGKLRYNVGPKLDASLEMLYSERGSTSSFGFSKSGAFYATLRYLEVPMMVMLKDWHIEDGDYHKVSAHAGLSLGYLFDITSSDSGPTYDISNYNAIDASYILGVNYNFTKRLGLTLRYTRAMTDLNSTKAVSYFLTVRTEYHF